MLSEPAAAIGTEGRGMNALEHEVAVAGNHVGLGTGIATPKHVDKMVATGGQCLNGGIGELLPAE